MLILVAPLASENTKGRKCELAAPQIESKGFYKSNKRKSNVSYLSFFVYIIR